MNNEKKRSCAAFPLSSRNTCCFTGDNMSFYCHITFYNLCICAREAGTVLQQVLQVQFCPRFIFHSFLPLLSVLQRSQAWAALSVSRTPLSRCCSSLKWTALCETERSAAKQEKERNANLSFKPPLCFISSFARDHHGSRGRLWNRAISLVS